MGIRDWRRRLEARGVWDATSRGGQGSSWVIAPEDDDDDDAVKEKNISKNGKSTYSDSHQLTQRGRCCITLQEDGQEQGGRNCSNRTIINGSRGSSVNTVMVHLELKVILPILLRESLYAPM